MEKIKVKILRRPDSPLELLGLAIRMTYLKKSPNKLMIDCKKKSRFTNSLIKNIIFMNHMSILEHITYTFLIEGASRSFLAQITRHRIATYTSASQHYQVYSGFNYIYPANIKATGLKNEYDKLMKNIDNFYGKLMKHGMPNYEARQVLPNACRNNLIVTMNARALFNFLNLRLCKKNTKEILIVAQKMHKLLITDCPEIFKYSGPDCVVSKCRQGHRSCGIPYNVYKEKESENKKSKNNNI